MLGVGVCVFLDFVRLAIRAEGPHGARMGVHCTCREPTEADLAASHGLSKLCP